MQNHTARTLASLATSALFLALAAPACDDHLTRGGDVALRVLPPDGGIWSDGDKGCDGFFFKTEVGSICLAPCSDDFACNVTQVDMCGGPVGNVSACDDAGVCRFACADDGDCIAGQRCAPGYDFCVWETMPAPPDVSVTPGEFGSCEPGNLADCQANHCTSNKVGSWCAADCVSDSQCIASSPVNECAENAPAKCVAGQCKIPCDDYSGCWGLDGMACDGLICVWAGAYGK